MRISEVKDDVIKIAETHAVQRNIATNARLFCTMLFVVALAGALMKGNPSLWLTLAVFSALPVGLAVVIDQLPAGRSRSFATLAVYLIPAAVTLLLLLNLG